MARQTSARGRPLQRALERWAPSASMLFVAVVTLARGRLGVGTAVGSAALLVLAWFLSPWFFPGSPPGAAARQRARAAGVPLIYWRPGCVYCLRLRLALGRLGNRAVWVDVSRDDDASDRVRSVTGGDETVPTVFVGDAARVNPAPTWVRGQLRES